MTIRAMIVDDEEPGRANLRHALAAEPQWRIAGEFADAAAARDALHAGDVDVVFLDIRMPGESGLALARELARQPAPPLVIFVTAYGGHAIDAFEAQALDYLLKPFDDERLARTLARAGALLEQRQRAAYGAALRDCVEPQPGWWTRLNVRSVGRIENVDVNEVLWIEAAGNYVELRLARRRVLHRVPIGTLERHLDPSRFVRVHRSALVRVDQACGLASAPDEGRTLLLRCGDVVPVSERYLARVRDLLGT